MPLTLYVVSSIILLGVIAGGIFAYLGVRQAVDGYQDENGFHPTAAPGSRESEGLGSVNGSAEDALSFHI